MIFTDGKSVLVRVSDALKGSLEHCAHSTVTLLDRCWPHLEAYDAARSLLRKVSESGDPEELATAEQAITRALAGVSDETLQELGDVQMAIHLQSLTAIIMSCFTSESYANALAHFLGERGVPLPGKKGRDFRWLSTLEKWKAISCSAGKSGFDTDHGPLPDLGVVFEFRNDHAHGKVVAFDHAPGYSSRFPDPVSGMLDLGHAIDAAASYWSVAASVYDSLDVSRADFERHYNLTPWAQAEQRVLFEELAVRYRAHIPAA